MQVRRDPIPFQLGRLVGPAPRDQGERRPRRSHRRKLLFTQAGRGESEQAHTPGTPCQLTGGLCEQALDLGPSQQRKRDEREPSIPGNGRGKRGHVADSRHRTLENRQSTAVGPGQWRILGKRAAFAAATRPRSTERKIAWTMPPTNTYFLDSSAASAAS